MTPQELKASILQLAIQGKLVEQRPEEGSGGELLRDILTQRRRVAESAEKKLTHIPRAERVCEADALAGVRRGEKADSLPQREEIPDSEKPFDIPESWVWVRLGEVASIERGSGIKRSETSQEGCPCVRYGEIYTSYGYSFTSTKSFVPESVATSCHMANHGDVLCTLTGEWKEEIAKATAYLGKEPIAIGGDLAKISSLAFNPILLVYFFFAPFMIQQKALKANGTMIVHIGKDAMCNLLIPLPPLAEQKRIVAKIEELLPYIDRYEKAWSKLENFNKRFPGDMQKSLLQMAIQGKLVDQRPEDGTGEELYRQIQSEKQLLIKSGKIKKEKPLSEITPDEIPFDIPESWKWYRIGELFSIINGFTPLKSNPEFWENGEIPWFTIEDVHRQGRFITSTAKFITNKAVSKGTERIVPADTVLLCCTASIGEYAYAKIPLTTNQQFNAFVTKPWYQRIVYPLYVFEFVKTLKARLISGAGKTTFNFLSVGKLSSMLIPLPPLAEQKRIVAKLEELLPLCERLK